MAQEQTPEQNQVDEETTAVETSPKTPGAGRLAGSRWQRLTDWLVSHKKLAIPAAVVLAILILAAIPFTRYHLAGLAVKSNFSVKVLDNTTGTPVSGAIVSIGSATAQTGSAGNAVLRGIKAGPHQLLIAKKYYRGQTVSVVTPIFRQKSVPAFRLVATGRQVKINVTNLISKVPLAGVDIAVAGITAKTAADGSAIVVLPAGMAHQPATLNLNGYNDAKVTVKVSNDTIQQNAFSLTPAGKVYFLSDLSGKIDVVKTNLDGTDRQTVVAGTGEEDAQNTVLLASHDWKYLALLSRRAGNYASLYLINTTNGDTVTTIDDGNADFVPVGWVDDRFVYVMNRNDIQPWQDGQQALKSYDAAGKKLAVLDSSTSTGTDSSDYLEQIIPSGRVYIMNGQIYYIKDWYTGYGVDAASALAGKQATFNSVNADGTAKKSIRSFGLAAGAKNPYLNLDGSVTSPQKVELVFFDGEKDNYFVYSNGQVKADPSMTDNSFAALYSAGIPVYLDSPSDSQTFWSEPRDGQQTLIISDADGQNQKRVATLSGYSAYGWYTDKYLLVDKANQLYIMAKDGSQPPVKISDYL